MYVPTLRSPCTSPPAATVSDCRAFSVVEVVEVACGSVEGSVVDDGVVVGRVVDWAVAKVPVERVEEAAAIVESDVIAAPAPAWERSAA